MSEYRKKAEECLRAAEKMRDAAQRVAMLGIARNYMRLADFACHADRIDKNLEIPVIGDWDGVTFGALRS